MLAVASTSGVRPGAFSAFTSAPRLSSSSATSTRFSPAAQWRGVPISELAPTVRLAPWSRRKVMISRSLLPQAIWMGERLLWAALMLAPLPTRYFTPSNELPMQAYVRGVSPTSSTASN